MAQNYQYGSLNPKDEFRLLLLTAGTDSDALWGGLIPASFGDDVKYDALSYAWGPDIFTKELITPQGVLPMTESLASALKCLRSRDEDVLMWADGVCINQSDNQEKSHQFRLMRDIYAGAEMVRVHLGDESDNSERVPALVETLNTVHIAARNKVGGDADSLLPPSTGDLVYIIHGMHTPYTMRRTAGRDDEHLRLVGQCYVNGIMDGEALTLPGYELRDIYIW